MKSHSEHSLWSYFCLENEADILHRLDQFRARPDHTIDLWLTPFQLPESLVSDFVPFLSADELSAADRMATSALRNDTIVSRVFLRSILSLYTQWAPHRIVLGYNANGKPMLPTADDLCFNVSHSGSYIALAFTGDCAIGVDIEKIRFLPDMCAIADRFFCAAEAADLRRMAPERRMRAFFRCWTRKEAYVKALGDGLAAPLDAFRVSLDRDTDARFLYLPEGTPPWSLYSFHVGAAYSGALAHPGEKRAINQITITNPRLLLSFVRSALGR